MKIDAAGSQEFFLPGGLLFAREKWVLAFGTEVLFSLFCVVLLSSDEAPQAQLEEV